MDRMRPITPYLSARVHITWIFTAICFGLVLGISVCRSLPYFGWPMAVIGLLLVVIGVVRRRRAAIAFVLIGAMVMGVVRGQITTNDYMDYADYFGKKVTVEGAIKDSPTQPRPGVSSILISNPEIEGITLPGIIDIDVPSAEIADPLVTGDIVIIRGVVSHGYGTVAASLLSPEVIAVKRAGNVAVLASVKKNAESAIVRSIGEPESSLGIGFLLGEKRELPADLIVALQVTGLTHIVVASGYNVSILVRIARRFFVKVSKFLAAFSGVILAGGFVTITGLSPSMTRAALVAGLSLWAWYVGRTFHPVTLLSFVAAVTVIVRPEFAWGDVGWQLSFAAFAGVMIVAPIIQAYFFGASKPRLLGQIAIETIAAQLLTAPIIIATFGQFSVIALFANMLIVPFVPLAMLLVFLAAVSSMIIPVIATIFAFPAQNLLSAMITVIETASQVAWAQVSLGFTWQLVAVSYLMIFTACIYMKWRARFSLRSSSVIE